MIYTNTRLEELKSITYKAQQLIERIENNTDNVEEKYIIRFFCETYPLGGRKDREILEIYEDMRTKTERGALIKSLSGVLRGKNDK